MPYQWLTDPDATPAHLHLWPHRSLSRRGFVVFIAATAGMITLPLLAQLGQPMFWGLLPFLLLTLAGLWAALTRSTRDGALLEVLTLGPDQIALERHNSRGPHQSWQANPYWVSVQLYPSQGPVPQYLTLKGAGREVELGAFLSPEERLALLPELQTTLTNLRNP